MSAETDAIAAALAAAATAPLIVEGDAGKVQNHPIPDLIAADKYFRQRDAVTTASTTPAANTSVGRTT